MVKQKQQKFADSIKKSCGFSKFNGNQLCWRQIFEILSVHKPFLGSSDGPQKIWSQSVQPF